MNRPLSDPSLNCGDESGSDGRAVRIPHEDAHRLAFASRHAHRPVGPIHDLLLNDVLSILLPTHRRTLYAKFAAVAAVLLGAGAPTVVWIGRCRQSRAPDPTGTAFVPVTLGLLLLELLLAWILYYRRVLRLLIDSVVHGEPTWWMDPAVVAVHRLPMHTSGLRLFEGEAEARRAACAARLATREAPPGTGRTPNVWNVDAQPWTFRLHGTVPEALAAVRGRAPPPTAAIAVPGHWMLQGKDGDGFGDKPIYTNIKYPFPCEPPLVPHHNPTGRYRLAVTFPVPWRAALRRTLGPVAAPPPPAAELTLLLHGAESAAYVFWNGTFVGFSKDSRLPSEFLIPHALIAGLDGADGGDDTATNASNVLEIVVARWSDGSYVEDQDHWWMAGLHRSVELVLRPPHADIRDFQVQADANGRLTCRVDCRSGQTQGGFGGRSVVVALYDDIQCTAAGDEWIPGACLFQSPGLPLGSDHTASLSVLIANTRLWTAETPNLYTLTITLLVDGEPTQVESCRVGFRSMSIENGQFRVNDKPITICGVNRHEHDPDHGKVVSLQRMKEDICLLKQNNFNAVRTSHYPNHPCFYRLCDFYGLYVCDEANIETHGMKPMGRLAHDVGWMEMFVTRVTRLVKRDRNHACIIFWSLGNEAGRGRNFQKARDLVKQFDPSRPVCYESGGAIHWGVGRTELTDVICNMYPDVPLTVDLATRSDEDRPVILCEYSHAMGNSNGNLHLYWKWFWDSDVRRLQGGYIWDMIDQGLRKTTKHGVSYFGYGGDFGDTCNDLQFCINGLFSPDRGPHPAVTEAKFLQQPVNLEPEQVDENGVVSIPVNEPLKAHLRLKVTNRYSFLDLSHLVWSWSIMSDTSISAIHSESFDVSSDASLVTIILGDAIQNNSLKHGHPYFLNIRGSLCASCSWADAGHMVVSLQFIIKFYFSTPNVSSIEPFTRQDARLTISNDDHDSIRVSRVESGTENVALAQIDRHSGSLVLFSPRGRNVLAHGLDLNTTRAITDNDQGGPDVSDGLIFNRIYGLIRGYDDFSYSSRWKLAGLDQKSAPTMRCSNLEAAVLEDKQRANVVSYCHVLSSKKQRLFSANLRYSVYGTERLDITCHVCPNPSLRWLSSLPRIGIILRLDASLFHIQYFGRGPHENYPDRKSGSELGVYETTPSKMGYLQYVYPVENGSRSDCEWVAFRRVDGTGLCISGNGQRFSCSALLYSATELNDAKHTCDLPKRNDGQHTIHVNLDHKLMGVGGDTSWYPVVYDEFKVKPNQDFDFTFCLIPLQAGDCPASLVRSTI